MTIIAAVALTILPTPPAQSPGLETALRMQQAVHFNAIHDWQTHQKAPVEPAKARPATTRTPAPHQGSSSTLARIRQCESGGSYTAVSPSGTYRGAYQFDRATWASVAAPATRRRPPAEQDQRAELHGPTRRHRRLARLRPMTDFQPPVDPIEHTATPLTDEEWIAYAEGCGFDPAIGGAADD